MEWMAIGWATLMVISAALLARRPLFACTAVLWVSALQNSVLPLMFRFGAVDASSARVLLLFKEVILILTLLTLAYQSPSDLRAALRQLWPAAALLGLLTVYLVLPIGPFLSARLIGLRYLGSPALLLICGWMVTRSDHDRERLLATSIAITVAAAAFGLIERYVLPLSFWRDIVGEGDYLLRVKGLQPYLNVSDGLNANHFAFGMRRLVTIYGDALSAGANLALGTILLLSFGLTSSTPRTKRALLCWAAVAAVATLATVSREAILTMLGGGTLALILLRRRISAHTWLLLSVLSILGVGGSAFLGIGAQLAGAFEALTSLAHGSTRVHLLYLVTGATVVANVPMGAGLGTSGFWSKSLFELATPGVGESAYFSMATQIGWGGAILLVWLLFRAARLLGGVRRIPAVNPAATALMTALLMRAVLSLFSENLFAFTGTAMLFLLVGATIRASSTAPGVMRASLTSLAPVTP